MGAYRYKIKPSAVITNVGNLPDGFTLHHAEYAFKPTNAGWLIGEAQKWNKQWEFNSGVVSCRSAWKRNGGHPQLITTAEMTIPDQVSVKVLVLGTTNCYDGVMTPLVELEERYEWGAVYAYPPQYDPATFLDDDLMMEDGWLVGTIWLYPPRDGEPAEFVFSFRELDAMDFDPLAFLSGRKSNEI